MNRIGIGVLVFALLGGLLAQPAAAQDDLAQLCPADTFFYVEADGGALVKGVPSMQLMQLAADPKVRDFFRPTLEKLRLDPKNPAKSLLKMARIAEYLPGKMAVGVRGLKIELPLPDGKTEVFEVAPGKPIDAKLMYRLMALWFVDEMNARQSFQPRVTLDFVAAVDPGPGLTKLAGNFFDSMGDALKRTKVTIGDKEVVHMKVDADRVGMASMMMSEAYVHFGAKRWIMASTKSGIASALAGGPRASLANSSRLAAARKRMTSGHRVLFAYADLEFLVDVFQKLIPPIVYDMNEINGLASLKGLGLGVSITEGGIRESVGIILDGNPKGVWTVLDAMPGGLKSLDFAPPGALASVGMKFDGKIFLDRLRAVTKEILPGAEDAVEQEIARELRRNGLDLHKDLLPALGDEVAMFVFPPKMGPIPELVLGLDIKDEAAFNRLLGKAKTALKESGEADVRPLDVNETIKGFQVFAPVPMSPSFCVHRGHFFGASSPMLLKTVCETWGTEGAKSMRKDGPVFNKVINGLNGGETDNLAALAYINVKGIVPIAMQFMPMVQGEIPEGWLDLTKIPNVPAMAGHLNGVALGLRNDKDGLTLDTFSPVGFIIPMTVLGMAMEQEMQQRRAQRAAVIMAQPRQASLGINAKASSGRGVEILGMSKNGPVAKAGLKTGDVIIAVNTTKTMGIDDLDNAIAKMKAGQNVTLTVRRGDKEFSIACTLVNRHTLR